MQTKMHKMYVPFNKYTSQLFMFRVSGLKRADLPVILSKIRKTFSSLQTKDAGHFL
jgi:hypothetical protein